MSVRRAALGLLLAATAAALVSVGPAGAADPSPLPPDQAQALATGGTTTSDSTTTAVDGLTALNASSLPGADTSIESGVSAQAAVGLAPLTEGNIISASKPVCWASTAWSKWGTWPYQQRFTDTTN